MILLILGFVIILFISLQNDANNEIDDNDWTF